MYHEKFSQSIRGIFFLQILKMNLLSKTIALQAQRATTCSKSTIKSVEQSVKYVQSQQQKHWNDVTGVFLVHLLLNFTPCSSASLVDIQQLNANWDDILSKAATKRYSLKEAVPKLLKYKEE